MLLCIDTHQQGKPRAYIRVAFLHQRCVHPKTSDFLDGAAGGWEGALAVRDRATSDNTMPALRAASVLLG